MELISTTEDEQKITRNSSSSSLEMKEKARLSNLLEYDLSDHEIDQNTLNPITTLAALICDMPLSFVTWVGSKHVDFLSREGCQLLGTCRENSFCHLAIQQDEIFEIEDSTKDPRFSENEFVKGQETPLTYYAGYPLKSPQGYNLGSLCVCDWKANKIDDKQRLALKTLANQVVAQLELKKQNKKLIEANQRAEVLSKAKDDFISNVSHELRTPLNAINGYANILSQSILDKDQEEAVTIIKNSSEILITLVNDILDFSKINSEKLKLEKIPFNLKKTVKLVYDLLLKKAIEKNISLDIVYDEKIPKKILGDKVRINQIIMNLVGNAIKFTQKGKVSIEVKLNLDKSCGSLMDNNSSDSSSSETKSIQIKSLPNSSQCIFLDFSVKDTGIGIPQDKINTIFERFEQAGTEITRKFGGTGLGLNISKNLVELHGGKLEVKSVYGEGSEFYFTICYDSADDISSSGDQKQISDLQKLNEEHFSKLAKLRVLVCEDNSVNIKLIKQLFKNKITYLEVAENGLIGIEMLKKKRFDVILMDLHMPEMDGIEATKYIRKVLKSKIPIIGFTANCSQEEKEFCLKSGMNDYLTKTFVNNDIYMKLADITSISKEYLEDEEEKFKFVNDPSIKRVKYYSQKFITKNLGNNSRKVSDENIKKNMNIPKRRQTNILNLEFGKSKKLFSSFKPNQLVDSFENNSSGKDSEEEKNYVTQIVTESLPPTSDQEVIDHVDLTSLNEMSSDEDFNKELIEYFLKNFPLELQSLKSDIFENNKKQLKFKVHKMKTPLSMFGLKNIIEKLEKIEKLCNNNENDLALIEYSYIDENIKIIFDELNEILNK
jgi:signal transduction histidine kinase/CheY-like chemotaxis protein/HPt (histidine-containing phosphotransfer) domain-containing protein